MNTNNKIPFIVNTHSTVLKIKNTYLAYILIFTLLSCEEVIEFNQTGGYSQLVVDAWISNQNKEQKIRLTKSETYFSTQTEEPELNATVTLTYLVDRSQVSFTDKNDNGEYTWTPPTQNDVLKIRQQNDDINRTKGDMYAKTYRLDITLANGNKYHAFSSVERTAKIDNISIYFVEKTPFRNPGIIAELYAKDLKGAGDAYWVKSYKNNILNNADEAINYVFDSSFEEADGVDNIVFIPPIRRLFSFKIPSSAVKGVDKKLQYSAYQIGDEVCGEVWSITKGAHQFLKMIRQQTNNRGLYAVPMINVPTNIIADGNSPAAVGYFCTSAVSRLCKRIDKMPNTKK